uniref:Uncharacterized protein n=1 Tax=Seriola lalandi dorsalis TaxID=1841481 RepID=A0A3B4WEV5_SERLL
SRRPMCRSRIGRHFRGGCCLLGGMHHHRINFDKYHPGEQTRVAIDKASFQSHRCYIYVFLHCCLIGSNVSDDNQCGATDKSLVYKQGNMLVWYKPQQKSHYHFGFRCWSYTGPPGAPSGSCGFAGRRGAISSEQWGRFSECRPP